jgi:outer membrane biosynthesis protein TonB
MSASSKSRVSKLLRVLVAGGVTLAGVHGAVRAEEPATDPAPRADQEKPAPKAKETTKPKQDQKPATAAKPPRSDKPDKPAEPEGGGVKGW